MSDPDVYGRTSPPFAGDEVTTLIGFLDYQRATFEWKCRGLDGAGLRATVGVSSMTLGGLIKHLAYVEDDWFSRDLLDEERKEPWASVDWDVDRDWDWHSAAHDTPEYLIGLWRRCVADARANTAAALAGGGLDTVARRVFPGGEQPSLRWIVVHMIEEYARHNGHADIIRESIDGEVGE